MFGSEILEVGMGLALVYLIVSILCTAVNEWIARLFALRAKTLESGIEKLLNDDEVKKKIYNHPLVKGLSREGWWERQIRRWTDKKDSSSKGKSPQLLKQEGRSYQSREPREQSIKTEWRPLQLSNQHHLRGLWYLV